MTNTRPEVRPDKNGHFVTRHVRIDDASAAAARIAKVNAYAAAHPAFDAGNEEALLKTMNGFMEGYRSGTIDKGTFMEQMANWEGETGPVVDDIFDIYDGYRNNEYSDEEALNMIGSILDGSVQNKPTLEEIKNTPTPQDLADGRESVRITIANNDWSYSFERMMGRGTRQTAGNVAEYRRKMDEVIDADPIKVAEVERTAKWYASRDSYARAYEQGVETSLDDLFDEIWEGKAEGYGREKLQTSLDGYRKDLDDLENGRITPGKVVGSGYRNPKKVAREWLEGQINETERALATKGRSHSVNVSNAEWRFKRRNQGKSEAPANLPQ